MQYGSISEKLEIKIIPYTVIRDNFKEDFLNLRHEKNPQFCHSDAVRFGGRIYFLSKTRDASFNSA
jgi:hypothetical protein